MKKRNRILLAGPLAIVAGGIAWLTLRTREPVYQGKKLSVWLELAGEHGNDSEQAEMAIRQIGTNALPYLIKIAAAKDSVLKEKLIVLLSRQSIVRIHFRRAADYHYAASEGLSLIIPALTNCLRIDENETNRRQIVAELENVGVHVTGMASDMFGGHLLNVRRVFLLDNMEDITELCRKAVTNALSDKSFSVRSAATNALKRIDATRAAVK